MSHDPVAYAYEADLHCPTCTKKRFGPACKGKDSEGNEVSATFSWDEEAIRPYMCGTCREIIEPFGLWETCGCEDSQHNQR